MSFTQRRTSRPATRAVVFRRAAIALALVGTSIAAGRTDAQQSASPDRLRLGELYAEVARANPRIAAANALATAARARVPGARRPPDPQLQLGFMNYTLPGLAPMPTLGMSQLQLMQMLPLGGKLASAGRAADAQASATDERARDTGWETRNAAAMAFYDLYAVDGQLDVARRPRLARRGGAPDDPRWGRRSPRRGSVAARRAQGDLARPPGRRAVRTARR